MEQPSDPEIEMLRQPLLTEEGAINPACINELEAAIAGMGKTHERLAGDAEWSERAKQWTFREDIVGAFAMWACRQSPYGVPDGLENVCKYLNAALKTAFKWDTSGMQELSLCDISKSLHEILMDQGIADFNAWNRCKKGETPEISFTSAFGDPGDPDYDFIDLDALLHNVCVTIRDERRKDKAFDEAFERDHPNGA